MTDKLHTIISCSKCNGKGKRRDLLKTPPHDIVDCPNCKGTGVITCLE